MNGGQLVEIVCFSVRPVHKQIMAKMVIKYNNRDRHAVERAHTVTMAAGADVSDHTLCVKRSLVGQETVDVAVSVMDEPECTGFTAHCGGSPLTVLLGAIVRGRCAPLP
jgi:hypothetical protein